jgi:hypothetical protein
VIGALNLYATRPGVFGPQEQAAATRSPPRPPAMSIVRPSAIKNRWCGSAKAASSANYPRSPATPSELDVTEAIGSDHQEPFTSPRGVRSLGRPD